jgi:hypothetical protein
MHAFTCTCIYIHILTFICRYNIQNYIHIMQIVYIYICVCVCVYVYTYLCVCVCVCVYIHIHTYINVYRSLMRPCIHTHRPTKNSYIRTCIQMILTYRSYIHTHIHTYIHTYMHSGSPARGISRAPAPQADLRLFARARRFQLSAVCSCMCVFAYTDAHAHMREQCVYMHTQGTRPHV